SPYGGGRGRRSKTQSAVEWTGCAACDCPSREVPKRRPASHWKITGITHESRRYSQPQRALHCFAQRGVRGQGFHTGARSAFMSIEITKLENGLIVATDPMPHLESAALGVWVGAGARHETPSEMGLAHMLEHMAFKGTATRSARDIATEIEAVGGELNAYTAREQTAFHARVLKGDVGLALDILSDIL